MTQLSGGRAVAALAFGYRVEAVHGAWALPRDLQRQAALHRVQHVGRVSPRRSPALIPETGRDRQRSVSESPDGLSRLSRTLGVAAALHVRDSHVHAAGSSGFLPSSGSPRRPAAFRRLVRAVSHVTRRTRRGSGLRASSTKQGEARHGAELILAADRTGQARADQHAREHAHDEPDHDADRELD